MASHNEEYEKVKEEKVLHISVYCLRSCTQNLSSQRHCTSSRGSYRTPDKQYYAYSMKNIDNFALPSDCEHLHIYVLHFI